MHRLFNKAFLTLVCFSFLPIALAGANSSNDPAEAFQRLTVDDVAAKLHNTGFYVYDDNSSDSFSKGHVPGAKWLSFTEVKAAALPNDKNASLVFYCANEQCMACHQAAEAAIKLGYKNVAIMPQGIQGWVKAGKAVEKG